MVADGKPVKTYQALSRNLLAYVPHSRRQQLAKDQTPADFPKKASHDDTSKDMVAAVSARTT
jgi:hypothetical protein